MRLPALQDAVAAAEVFEVTERDKNGQLYVDYLIESPGEASCSGLHAESRAMPS